MSVSTTTFRRLERVDFYGVPIDTVLDESGKFVWVSIVSIIEGLALPKEREFNKFSDDKDLYRSMHVHKMICYGADNRKHESLFMPLEYLNDYLYSIDVKELRDDTTANLLGARREMCTAIDRHYIRIAPSESGVSPIGLRHAVLTHAMQELKRALSTYTSYCGYDESEKAERIEAAALQRAVQRCTILSGSVKIVPTSMMTVPVLEAYIYYLGRYRDMVLHHMEIGTEPRSLFSNVEQALADRPPRDLNRYLRGMEMHKEHLEVV